MKKLGITLIGLAFALAALAGLWIASQVSSDDGSDVTMVAIGAFIVITPLAIVGIYFYVQEEDDDEEPDESIVLKQRELMDLLRERGQIQIQEAAIILDTTPQEIHEMLEQLIVLEIFSGYIDWENGFLYAVPPKD